MGNTYNLNIDWVEGDDDSGLAFRVDNGVVTFQYEFEDWDYIWKQSGALTKESLEKMVKVFSGECNSYLCWKVVVPYAPDGDDFTGKKELTLTARCDSDPKRLVAFFRQVIAMI